MKFIVVALVLCTISNLALANQAEFKNLIDANIQQTFVTRNDGEPDPAEPIPCNCYPDNRRAVDVVVDYMRDNCDQSIYKILVEAWVSGECRKAITDELRVFNLCSRIAGKSITGHRCDGDQAGEEWILEHYKLCGNRFAEVLYACSEGDQEKLQHILNCYYEYSGCFYNAWSAIFGQALESEMKKDEF